MEEWLSFNKNDEVLQIYDSLRYMKSYLENVVMAYPPIGKENKTIMRVKEKIKKLERLIKRCESVICY